MPRRAVLVGHLDFIPERLGRLVDVGADDVSQQAPKLAVGQSDSVERLKLVSEILLKARPVFDVRAMHVA